MRTRNHPEEKIKTKVEAMPEPPLSNIYYSLVAATILFILLGAVLMLTTSCQNDTSVSTTTAPAEPLTFFVAASMTDAMTRAVENYSGEEVKLNFAASSTLARQIDAGAEADLYLSANKKWMDFLVEKGLVEPHTVRVIASNRLVLITPATDMITYDATTPLAEAFEGRLSLGDPEHVPAGMYAKTALENLGWWADLESRTAPAPDVRQALRTVAVGEVEAGIVYSTDAQAERKVALAWTFPADSHPPVLYYVAVLKDAAPEALAFEDYLMGADTAAVLKELGFAEPPEEK